MAEVTLFQHQEDALERTKFRRRVAYYHDMGLGKTFTGAEKMDRLGGKRNLIICQKSKVGDWCEHFRTFYPDYCTYDLTQAADYRNFFTDVKAAGIINYDLIFRRPELLKLSIDTLMLDESSLIQNETAKRTKAVFRLKVTNVILLSGTPTGGKYETLWTQMRLLGWQISKTEYWNRYICYRIYENEGFPIKIVTGYKNTDDLKRNMRKYGCHFLKTDEVLTLPEQRFIDIEVPQSPEYRRFLKSGIVRIGDRDLVGDGPLTRLLYSRMLAGAYSDAKREKLLSMLESTADRIIIFYNFSDELAVIRDAAKKVNRALSVVNGQSHDLTEYSQNPESLTAVQYQAGGMGLNLQLANKIVYYSPPLSSELYEQSKKRIHRIGQERHCVYFRLIVKDSVESRIYETLAMRRDYTDALFTAHYGSGKTV